jgi:hypothetical protein
MRKLHAALASVLTHKIQNKNKKDKLLGYIPFLRSTPFQVCRLLPALKVRGHVIGNP